MRVPQCRSLSQKEHFVSFQGDPAGCQVRIEEVAKECEVLKKPATRCQALRYVYQSAETLQRA